MRSSCAARRAVENVARNAIKFAAPETAIEMHAGRIRAVNRSGGGLEIVVPIV